MKIDRVVTVAVGALADLGGGTFLLLFWRRLVAKQIAFAKPRLSKVGADAFSGDKRLPARGRIRCRAPSG